MNNEVQTPSQEWGTGHCWDGDGTVCLPNYIVSKNQVLIFKLWVQPEIVPFKLALCGAGGCVAGVQALH